MVPAKTYARKCGGFGWTRKAPLIREHAIRNAMNLKEGHRLKSKLTGTIYEIKKIRDASVVLQSEDGSNQEWTNKGKLKLFFEEIQIKTDEWQPGG